MRAEHPRRAQPGLKNPSDRAGVSASRPARLKSPEFTFERADWTLFRSLSTLSQKAGVPVHLLPKLVLKELADNALDAGGTVRVGQLQDGGWYVEDDGPGIPGEPADIARLFSIRRPLVSSKLLRLPTRGALGNGLRVVAGAVLASDGSLVLETRGRRLELRPQDSGDTLAAFEPCSRTAGTRIEIESGRRAKRLRCTGVGEERCRARGARRGLSGPIVAALVRRRGVLRSAPGGREPQRARAGGGARRLHRRQGRQDRDRLQGSRLQQPEPGRGGRAAGSGATAGAASQSLAAGPCRRGRGLAAVPCPWRGYVPLRRHRRPPRHHPLRGRGLGLGRARRLRQHAARCWSTARPSPARSASRAGSAISPSTAAAS